MEEGTRTLKVATLREDSRPHVAPVWFVMDGNDLVFTTGARSVKGKNLRRNPQLSMCVEDETPPYSFVLIDGEARVVGEGESILEWTTRIGGRYMGQDRADEYGRRNAVAGELLIRVTPTKVIAEKDIAD